jgi:hypothetical protein
MKQQKYIKCSSRIAQEWGLEVAVAMEQITYWLTLNSDKPDSMHEGTVWFYCSIRELTDKYFPYWTPRQLASLLDYMVKVGLLRIGRFNKVKYDRTKWYTVTDSRILEEDDYIPERKTMTKRRAISRPPVCNAIHADVKGSDTDVEGSNAGVKGTDAGVTSNALSCGTYTTTKQQLTTEKETEKEQLNILTRSRVEGGTEPPSKDSNVLFETEEGIEDGFPLPHTEGVNPPAALREGNVPPLLRRGVDSPRKENVFDEMFPTVRAAPKHPSPEDIGRIFEELFREKPHATQSHNTFTQPERIQL